jgi:hypothetical protein
MTNWLYIYEGKVVHIIDQEETPSSNDYADGIHDTVAQDDSKTFKVGDDFTAELQLQYNKDLWIEKGWIDIQPTDIQTLQDGQTTE